MYPKVDFLQGDALTVLRTLPDNSVHCCVTSPPYWGLRDYGVDGQLGLEKTPEEYVAKMVEVFREVSRVLREDGTLWINMGDSYYNYRPGLGQALVKQTVARTRQDLPQLCARRANIINGLKEKDLCGIPWRVAFALQADGWWLRHDIIWHKPNPMPERVTDRCTKAHEYIFLMTKSQRYYYDADAIRETFNFPERIYNGNTSNHKTVHLKEIGNRSTAGLHDGRTQYGDPEKGRNKRSVWTVTTKPYSEAHFATFPPELIKPCILAGCPMVGTVLDPFGGSGTTGMVALELGRKAILIELNPKYMEFARKRCEVTPALALA